MKKYLAISIDNDQEYFDDIKEAREYLEEMFLESGEGYHPDADSCKIYVLKEKVECEVIATKDDFTDEEWKDEGYNSDYYEIWKHKFVKQIAVI